MREFVGMYTAGDDMDGEGRSRGARGKAVRKCCVAHLQDRLQNYYIVYSRSLSLCRGARTVSFVVSC